MNKNVKSLNIVIEPTDEVREYSIRKSEEVVRLGDHFFKLDRRNYFPHITLYQNEEFLDDRLNDILASVKAVSEDIKPFSMNFSNSLASKSGWVHAEVIVSKELIELQREILGMNKDFVIPEAKQRGSEGRSPKEVGYVKKYAAHNVLDLYNPHLTLTRFRDEKIANKVVKDINWNINSMVVNGLAVYEMGEHGTCNNLIQKFDIVNN